MFSQAIIWFSRALCLVLVLSTGVGSVAYAGHDGSHGSHCISSGQDEVADAHEHEASHEHASAGSEGEKQSCIQHSCVGVFSSAMIQARVQRLASAILTLRGDLRMASMNAENLHRPPIA